jgi:glycosyltransferase involved in cell wall biosynthesis
MNIIVSAGGKFHAFKLAKQLYRTGNLHTLCTFDYTTRDQGTIPPHKVYNATTCKIFNQLILRLRLARFIDKNVLNRIKDNAFDYLVSHKLSKADQIDLFVVWAHYAQRCIPVARAKGAKIIIESGSCHIQTQQRLLEDEYQQWAIAAPPIHPRIIQKMTTEYAQADYIMTLSRFARQSFLDHGFAPNKILRAPCGVDVDFFYNPLRTAPTKFRVIFVGLVTLRKGVQHLIQAWHKAGLPLNETELVIVGAVNKDFATITSRLPITPNITFTGPVNRTTLRTMYNQSSLFVLPSIEDGFGMVIGEAMASGLPVICSSHTAGPDLFTDGAEGFIIAPGDVDALANKIRWCYEHQAQAAAMGVKGMHHITAFTWDNYGDAVQKLYRQVLAS